MVNGKKEGLLVWPKGGKDEGYLIWRWKPKNCDLPRELVAMDIEGQGNQIHANENLNSISIITTLDALIEVDKKRSTNPPTPIVSSTPSTHTGGSGSRIGNHKCKFDYLADLRLGFSDSLMDLMRDAISRFRRLLRLWLLLLAQIWRPSRIAFLLLL
ncbi:hypothetical protein Cgig2_010250 [Carnegiea gigantea]|uniref:Uncharacterized protein n=1 Tax=Carnegiea gigantea TaxID=171969 RepID=A0A9Q1GJ59_9CARY|nr:hypothetical protein Cgig2_010250 [Carnegiea gigantea]